jgi:hypothetical protein
MPETSAGRRFNVVSGETHVSGTDATSTTTVNLSQLVGRELVAPMA